MMPRYEYRCESCGPFIQWMSMSEVTETVACPDCEEMSYRAYSAPGLIMTSQALRQRIERGVEPKIVRKEKHSHERGSCQHGGHSHARGSQPQQHAPKRPWMVGH
jgi:putative FmdB family regulatory protein